MSTFAIIFAVLILSLFWGGFVVLLNYSLKLKGQERKDDKKRKTKEKIQKAEEEKG
jgi:hypothetical protein